MERQTKLPLGIRPAHRNDDYVNLFPFHIFPTGDLDILERGGNILLVKSYEWSKMSAMPKSHRRIWLLMPQFGHIDAPGNVAVVCVEGLGHTPRKWIVFDHQGEHPLEAGTLDDWRTWLHDWFLSNRRHR